MVTIATTVKVTDSVYGVVRGKDVMATKSARVEKMKLDVVRIIKLINIVVFKN